MNPENPPPPEETGLSPLERRMARQSMRSLPSSWRAEILGPKRSKTDWFAAVREFLVPTPWAWGALLAAWTLVALFSSSAERTARNGTALVRRDLRRGNPPLLEWRHRQALISALLEEAPAPERPPIAPPRPRSSLSGPRFGRNGSSSTIPSLV